MRSENFGNMAPKRHRSYTSGFKLNVVSRAEVIGNRAAGREFEIDERCIRRWRAEKEELKKMPLQKRAKRSGTIRWPNLEKDLLQWITDQREKGLSVSTTKIRIQAKLMARHMNIEDFKGGPAWCYRFMKRAKISVRVRTTVGQQLPLDWQEKKEAFLKYIKDVIQDKKFMPSHVINMDETPLFFDCPANRTVDKTGTKTVSIITTGHERMAFTCVLACAANGDKLKPMIIFKRKTIPKGDFPPDIIICANDKGWMCEDIMFQWIEKVWQRRKGSFFDRKGFLVMDSMRSHLLDSVKSRLKKASTDLAVIPGGLTKLLQPLDLTVNKCFKAEVRKQWERWMAEGLHSYTKSGKMRRASYEEVAKWVHNAWKSIPTSTIISGFKEAEIIAPNVLENSLSGENNCCGDDDDDDDDEDDDINLNSSLSEDILNLFNSDDDESDFDGFE